jgi:DNA-binding NtrC family response regulator
MSRTSSVSPRRVLAVDDSPPTVELLYRNLKAQGFEVLCASSVAEAVELLDKNHVDLVLTDVKMPRVSGHDLVRHVRQNCPHTEVVVITGYPTVQGAVEAVREGAEEYLPKPFTDDELRDVVQRALAKLQARQALDDDQIEEAVGPAGIVGASRAIRRVFRAVAKASATTATVLVTGESGTGKELVARAIHYGSARASMPFVPVNCAGIPAGLLESELFGYVRGAFTGAQESRAGFFLTADSGTLMLDELGDTPLEMQAKLLRVLQEREVVMVGDRKGRKVDVRVIGATNRDLFAMVRQGTFREDLYFRVNVITIDVPPLRARGDDVLLLARHFAEKYATELSQPVPSFSDKALKALRQYAWPGNVRELENVVQRAVVMSDDDQIDVTDFPSHMRFSAPAVRDVNQTLAQVEAQHVAAVIARVDGNRTQAARILGVDRKTLRHMLRRHGLA